MENRERVTHREIISEINGVVYEVSVHYAAEGETVTDKLTRLICLEAQADQSSEK